MDNGKVPYLLASWKLFLSILFNVYRLFMN
jgi:hypothetical protein